MKVGIFYNSISNPAKFSNKVMLMDNFKTGVLANGDKVVEFHSNQLPSQSLNAGFVLGYTLEDNFRKKLSTHSKNKIPRQSLLTATYCIMLVRNTSGIDIV